MSKVKAHSGVQGLHQPALPNLGLSANAAAAKPAEELNQDEVLEVDCPWFDVTWLLDHPDFPLSPRAVGGINMTEEDS